MDDQRSWPRKRDAFDRGNYGPPPPFKRGRFEQPPLPGPPQPFGGPPGFRPRRGSPPHRSGAVHPLWSEPDRGRGFPPPPPPLATARAGWGPPSWDPPLRDLPSAVARNEKLLPRAVPVETAWRKSRLPPPPPRVPEALSLALGEVEPGELPEPPPLPKQAGGLADTLWSTHSVGGGGGGGSGGAREWDRDSGRRGLKRTVSMPSRGAQAELQLLPPPPLHRTISHPSHASPEPARSGDRSGEPYGSGREPHGSLLPPGFGGASRVPRSAAVSPQRGTSARSSSGQAAFGSVSAAPQAPVRMSGVHAGCGPGPAVLEASARPSGGQSGPGPESAVPEAPGRSSYRQGPGAGSAAPETSARSASSGGVLGGAGSLASGRPGMVSSAADSFAWMSPPAVAPVHPKLEPADAAPPAATERASRPEPLALAAEAPAGAVGTGAAGVHPPAHVPAAERLLAEATPSVELPAVAATPPVAPVCADPGKGLAGDAGLVPQGPGSGSQAASEKTPASDDPPKRKRLGWGQGLARLRSSGAKEVSGACGEASPTAGAEAAVLPHTQPYTLSCARADSDADRLGAGSRASSGEQALPAGAEGLGSGHVGPGAADARSAGPAGDADGVSGQAPAAWAVPPPPLLALDVAVPGAVLRGTGLGGVGPLPGVTGVAEKPLTLDALLEAEVGPPGSPKADPSPRIAAAAAAPLLSPQPPLPLSPPPPLPTPAAEPSKDSILGGIEKADADIAEAEAELAALEASAAEAAAAARVARASAADLAHAPTPPVPPTDSDSSEMDGSASGAAKPNPRNVPSSPSASVAGAAAPAGGMVGPGVAMLEPEPGLVQAHAAPQRSTSGSLKKAWAAAALAESSAHTAGSAGTDARRRGSGRSASASASAAATAAVTAGAAAGGDGMGEAVDMAEAVSMEADSQGQAPAESSGCTPCDGGLAGDDGGVEAVVSLNIERAAEARRALLRLLPPTLRPDSAQDGAACPAAPKALYHTPQEAPPYARNLAEHERVGPAIAAALRARKRALLHHEQQLAAQYRRLFEAWRVHITGARKLESSYGPGGGFTGRMGSRKSSGMVRSSYEEEQVVLQLQAVERMKDMCKIPPQLLCPHEREAQRFDSSNALVSDPMAALEAEERERPWATEEKRIFNEKFLAFPKACAAHIVDIVFAGQDFRRIATFLDQRSTADCISHYYRTQKLDEFAAVRRKQQLKKRRTQTEVNRSITYLGVAAPPGARRADTAYGRASGGARAGYGAYGLPPADPPGRGGKGARGPRVRAGASAKGRVDRGDPLYPGEGGPLVGAGGGGEGFENSVSWTADEEALFVDGVRQFGRDPHAIRRLMGGSRTLGAIKSFYSKNRSRLGLDRLLEQREAAAAAGAAEAEAQPTASPQLVQGLGLGTRAATGAPAADAAELLAADEDLRGLSPEPTPNPALAGSAPAGAAAVDADADEANVLAMRLGFEALTEASANGGAPPRASSPLGAGLPVGMQGANPTPVHMPHVMLQQLAAAAGGGPPGGLLGFPGVPPNIAAAIAMQAYNNARFVQMLQQMPQQVAMQHFLAGQGLGQGMGQGMVQGLGQGLAALPPSWPPAGMAGAPGGNPNAAGGGNSTASGGLPGGGGYLPGMAALQGLQGLSQAMAHSIPPAFAGLQQLPAHLQSMAFAQALSAASHASHPGFSSAIPSSSNPGQPLSQAAPSQAQAATPGGRPLGYPAPIQAQAVSGGFSAPAKAHAADGREHALANGSSAPDQASAMAAVARDAAAWDAPAVPVEPGAKRPPSFWNDVEKQAFLDAFKAHGRKWAQLEAAVPTKTSTQIKNYYQNYKGKLGLDKADQPRSIPPTPPRAKRARVDGDDAGPGSDLGADGAASAEPLRGDPNEDFAEGVPVYPESLFAIRQQAERAGPAQTPYSGAPTRPSQAAIAVSVANGPAACADAPVLVAHCTGAGNKGEALAGCEGGPDAPAAEAPALDKRRSILKHCPRSTSPPRSPPGFAAVDVVDLKPSPSLEARGGPALTLGMHDIRSALGKSLGLLSPSFSAQLRQVLAAEAPAAEGVVGSGAGLGDEHKLSGRSASASAAAPVGSVADERPRSETRTLSLPEGSAGRPPPSAQAPSRLHAAGAAAGEQAAERLDPDTMPGRSAGALSALRPPQASCGLARARDADTVGPNPSPDPGGPAGGSALGAARPAGGGGGGGDGGRVASVGFGLPGGERDAGNSMPESGRGQGAEEFAAAAGPTSGPRKLLGALGSLPLGSSADGAAKP